MDSTRKMLLRWVPAVLWMAAIFGLSATPGNDLPQFGSLDYLLKKSGHILGYAILGLAFRWALDWGKRRYVPAWLLAIGYALFDEWHQSFVAGRHPSLLDAFGFDALGAAAALWLSSKWSRPVSPSSGANPD